MFPYWENKLRELFPDNLTTAVNTFIESGARGIGKEQPISEPVLSKNGFVPMGEIKVGSQVYTADGTLCTVTDVFPQGKKDVYEITFSDKTSTRCGLEHLWEVIDTHYFLNHKYQGPTKRILTTQQLLKYSLHSGTQNRFKIPMNAPIQFPSHKPFISSYLLGLLLGDGCFRSGIRLTSIDKEILEACEQEVANNNYQLVKSSAPNSKAIAATIIKTIKNNSANIYIEEIKRLKLKSCHSIDKFIPKEYLYNDVENRVALLQGLMDTDGTCNKAKRRNGKGYTYSLGYSTISEQLANDVVWLVQSLGGIARINKKSSKYRNPEGNYIECAPHYRINIKLPSNIDPFRIKRKLEKYRSTQHVEPTRFIKSIIKLNYREEAQCIMVDHPSHLYVTKNFIVTHNSELAVSCGLYLMHRLMCLKDPHLTLNLKPSETVDFAFMNITEELSYDIGVTKFQNTVQASPWFLERGTLTGRKEVIWNPPEWINIIVGSQPRHVIGKAIYFAFFDEISFIANQDIEKQKAKAIDMIDTAIGGMKTRFTNKGVNPTLLILASSKRSEKSFLETHTKKKMETDKENLLVVDEPIWKVRPASEYSGKRFKVAQGNKYLASEVLPDDVDTKPYIDKGYKILDVPVEYKANFMEDIDRALCDFAGVSSSDLTKYISGVRLQAVKSNDILNGFSKDIIEVGNAPDDKTQYDEFFDLTRIPEDIRRKPLFIHLDMSLSGDRTGIGGVFILGKKPTPEGQPPSKDLFFQTAFGVAIKAPKGYQVSMEKNRNFIRWLKQNGFKIVGISADSYQSADLIQQLKAEKFDCKVISVDKVNSDKICEPYQYFKNVIYEERIKIFDSELLTTEILGLERNSNGVINHPDEGRSGSKDLSDAICGATWNASFYAEQFTFEYGENIETMLNVNESLNATNLGQQITVDFETEMQNAFKLMQQDTSKNDASQLDFGMGPSIPIYEGLVSDGILLW